MRLYRCHGCGMNNIFYCASAGKVVARSVETLENSEAVRFPDALCDLVADVSRLQIRENKDVGPSCDRTALGFTRSYLRNERGIELHLAVQKKVGSKLVGNLNGILYF